MPFKIYEKPCLWTPLKVVRFTRLCSRQLYVRVDDGCSERALLGCLRVPTAARPPRLLCSSPHFLPRVEKPCISRRELAGRTCVPDGLRDPIPSPLPEHGASPRGPDAEIVGDIVGGGEGYFGSWESRKANYGPRHAVPSSLPLDLGNYLHLVSRLYLKSTFLRLSFSDTRITFDNRTDFERPRIKNTAKKIKR